MAWLLASDLRGCASRRAPQTESQGGAPEMRAHRAEQGQRDGCARKAGDTERSGPVNSGPRSLAADVKVESSVDKLWLQLQDSTVNCSVIDAMQQAWFRSL